MLSYQVDAVIGQFQGGDDEPARHAGGLPLVLLDRSPDRTRFGAVGIALPDALEELAAHLHAAGHRCIGMLDGSVPGEPSPRRRHLLSAARARRMTTGPQWVVSCADHTVEAGEAAMETLLDVQPGVTAVFGFNDLIAVGAMRAARRRGLRIPHDVAVAGFDGLALGALVEPPLTTLAIDKRARGRTGRPDGLRRASLVRPGCLDPAAADRSRFCVAAGSRTRFERNGR